MERRVGNGGGEGWRGEGLEGRGEKEGREGW